LRGNVEGVGRIHAEVGIVGRQADRGHVSGGLIDEDTGTGHEEILVDGPKLELGPELCASMINAGADHEVVVMPARTIGRCRSPAKSRRNYLHLSNCRSISPSAEFGARVFATF